MTFLLVGVASAADAPALPTEKVRIPRSLLDIELVKIPAGNIEMPVLDRRGRPLSDGSKQTVAIKSIWIEKTELPWEVFDLFYQRLDLDEQGQMAEAVAEGDLPKAARSRPSQPFRMVDRGFGHEGYPAISIQYNSAQKFCLWLSTKTGRKFRLPTEPEWEYACRAGGPPVKLDEASLAPVAWFAANSAVENGDLQTRPIATKRPNPWGLYDMLGNAAEWTTLTDKLGAVKGGSYLDKAADLHSAARALYTPDWQLTDPEFPKSNWWLSDGPHVGFRVVRED